MLSFNEVHSRYLPPMDTSFEDCLLTINFSLRGICECYSVNHNYIYVNGGDFVISNEVPSKPFSYPLEDYIGIEFYIFRQALTQKDSPLKHFNIGIEAIIDNYLEQHSTFITNSIDCLSAPFDFLKQLYELGTPDLSLLKLNAFQILRLLTTGLPNMKAKSISALTSNQMEMAKEAETILTKDLSIRIPIHTIANTMGISETSLKNYFHAVFGQNISSYMLEKRLKKAKELLKNKKLSILEVANAVGYENQSKFTNVFRKNVGMTPRDYRKHQLKE